MLICVSNSSVGCCCRSARMKLLRLERDNQHLVKTTEELKQATARMAALEVKNKEVQQQSQEGRSQMMVAQEVCMDLFLCDLHCNSLKPDSHVLIATRTWMMLINPRESGSIPPTCNAKQTRYVTKLTPYV